MKRLSLVAVLVAVALVFAGAPAGAQLPSLPPVPQVPVPEPVADAATQAIDTVLPVVGNAAIQLRPVATAGGFALRAPCATLGGATFVLALASSLVVVPFPTNVLLGPALIFCSGAFNEGPADPLIQQADAAVGDTFEDQASVVLNQVSAAIAPAKENLDQVCGLAGIFGETFRNAPPPLHRPDYVAAVCG